MGSLPICTVRFDDVLVADDVAARLADEATETLIDVVVAQAARERRRVLAVVVDGDRLKVVPFTGGAPLEVLVEDGAGWSRPRQVFAWRGGWGPVAAVEFVIVDGWLEFASR